MHLTYDSLVMHEHNECSLTSFAEFVKRGMDPTSIAVMMEDGAACAGLVIAGQTYLPTYSP